MIKNRQISNTYVNQRVSDASLAWPLFKLIGKINLNPDVVYCLIAIVTYVIFLFLTLISINSVEILKSSMHLLQVCCSIAIFGVFYLGRYSANKIEKALWNSKNYIEINDTDFWNVYNFILNKIGSFQSLFLTIPITFVFFILMKFIGQYIPNTFFPVSRHSAIFIYIAYFEICIVLTYLLCSICLWCLIILTQGFLKMGKCELKLKVIKTTSEISQLSKSILAGTILQLLGFSLVMPFLVYIVFSFNHLVVLWIGLLGTGSAYLVLLFLIFTTQYSIYKLLLKAKTCRLNELSHAVSLYDQKINEFPEGFLSGNNGHTQLKVLIELNEYLLKIYDETNRDIKVWFFDISSLSKLLLTNVVPVFEFIRMIVKLLN
jgi:hypothetical protein